MSLPTPDQFEAFYKAVHGKTDDPKFGPFPWQKRVSERVCDPARSWPRAIALPTAAGKTACIDIAVFALACGAKDVRQPRRIFFVVDRRIVVDQAFGHAKALAKMLDRAADGVLHGVADSLRNLARPGWLQLPAADRLRILSKRWEIQATEDASERLRLLRGLEADEREWFEISPLDVYALRGGMYRESAWARSPLQPTVIASTVDQIGSRLLFRGYGVSESMMPVHAGLVGNDALILLDEAHCAKPFDQTVQAVESYRTWAEEQTRAPFRFVSVTATPTGGLPESEIARDDDTDRVHPILGKRISASKPTALVVAEKAKGKTFKQWGKPLVEKLAQHAKELASPDGCVGIIVNRVATARALAKELGDGVVLLTGRMRPLDRDRIFEERLKPLLSGGSGPVPKFVVGTQCLECGADFDFHALVTECASLDALRQRFGRLNRVAARPGAKAVVVVRADQTEIGTEDPIYGCSLSNAWKWMEDNADGKTEDSLPWIDFGVASIRAKWEATSAENREAVNAPSPDAPVLFPTHLDCWVQTRPIPTPDPDPALFLHGPKQTGQPDVQVVFRADLGEDTSQWAEIVSLCPPSSSEAVAVPLGVFKKWLADELTADETADVEGGTPPEPDDEKDERPQPRHALRWRGPEESEKKTRLVSAAKDVTPNDTYVIRVPAEGDSHELEAVRRIADLGEAVTDYAEEAFQRSRDKALLRLPKLMIPENADKREESELVSAAIGELLAQLSADAPAWVRRAAEYFINSKLRNRLEVTRHPLGGVVVTGTIRLRQFDPTHLDDSEPAESFRGRAVTLAEHSRGVADHATWFAKGCGLEVDFFTQAGLWHDLGKLDPRFQAMLRQSSPRTVVGKPLAKSGKASGTWAEREQLRQVHKYPKGARHELLSAALVAEKYAAAPADDLLLHLIATHHGSARPFASAVDDLPSDAGATWPFAPELFEQKFSAGSYRQQIREWNAELPERFWRVVRKYGWWGGAYREAVFRLADHAQSAAEQEADAVPAAVTTEWVPLSAKITQPKWHALPLVGLDGANLLGFLAALGTLIVCDEFSRTTDRPDWLRGPVALSWGGANVPSMPVLHLPVQPPSTDEFADFLGARLAKRVEDHAAEWVVRMLELGMEKGAERDFTNITRRAMPPQAGDRHRLDWVTALSCESAIDVDSQLQTVRCDYLIGNIRSVLHRTEATHLRRTLFALWDYADALNNQSLHWEPGEDRRHAYQWLVPTNARSRETGGMLGANRLALEAWPLFPSFPDGDRVRTRGFRGNRAGNTFWLWPLWSSCLTANGVASLLALSEIQSAAPDAETLRAVGITSVFRSQRILVGKTPNLTPAEAVA